MRVAEPTGRRRRLASAIRYAVLASSAVVVLASPGPALGAVSIAEPNNDIVRAFGPLQGGVEYEGTVDATDKTDLIYLVPQPGQQVNMEVTVGALTGTPPDCSPPVVAVNEGASTGDRTTTVHEGQPQTVAVGAHQWALYTMEYETRSDTCGPANYKIVVTGGTLAAAAPGVLPFATQPVATDGANFDALRPFGPLAPNTIYEGGIDARRQAFYVILVQPGRAARITVVNGTGCPARFPNNYLPLLPGAWPRTAFGSSAGGVDKDRYVGGVLVTNDGATVLPYVFAVIADCQPSQYQIMATPAESLSIDPVLLAQNGPSRNPQAALGRPTGGLRMAGGVVYHRTKPDAPPDQFRFRVRAGSRVSATLMQGSSPCSGQASVLNARLSKDDGDSGDFVIGVYPDWFQRDEETLSAGERVLTVSGGCQGATYQLRVDPASAIVGPVATKPSAASKKVRTRISVRRTRRGYSGVVRASDTACRRSRSVAFFTRKTGRRIGRVRSRRDGTFTWRRKHRVKQGLRVVAGQTTVGRLTCGSASRKLR